MEWEFSKFRESDKSLKHELGPIKEPVSHVCLVYTVVAPWSLTPEVAGSNSFDDKYFQSLNSANSMIHLGKTQIDHVCIQLLCIWHWIGKNV